MNQEAHPASVDIFASPTHQHMAPVLHHPLLCGHLHLLQHMTHGSGGTDCHGWSSGKLTAAPSPSQSMAEQETELQANIQHSTCKRAAPALAHACRVSPTEHPHPTPAHPRGRLGPGTICMEFPSSATPCAAHRRGVDGELGRAHRLRAARVVEERVLAPPHREGRRAVSQADGVCGGAGGATQPRLRYQVLRWIVGSSGCGCC